MDTRKIGARPRWRKLAVRGDVFQECVEFSPSPPSRSSASAMRASGRRSSRTTSLGVDHR